MGESQQLDSLKDTQCPRTVCICHIFRCFETDGYMAHRGKVVDLIGLHFLDDTGEVHTVGHISIVQKEVAVVNMGVLIQVVDTVCVEKRRTALDTVDNVPFFKQKFRQVRAVLSCNACDEGNFGLF